MSRGGHVGGCGCDHICSDIGGGESGARLCQYEPVLRVCCVGWSPFPGCPMRDLFP